MSTMRPVSSLAAELRAPLPRLYVVSDGRPVERRVYYEELARLLDAVPPLRSAFPWQRGSARRRATNGSTIAGCWPNSTSAWPIPRIARAWRRSWRGSKRPLGEIDGGLNVCRRERLFEIEYQLRGGSASLAG